MLAILQDGMVGILPCIAALRKITLENSVSLVGLDISLQVGYKMIVQSLLDGSGKILYDG